MLTYDWTKNGGQVKRHPTILPTGVTPLGFLCYPWIATPQSSEDKTHFADNQTTFKKAGFDGAEVIATLEDIRKLDRHLRDCCPSPSHLAYLFDSVFLSLALEHGDSERALSDFYDAFEAFVYKRGRFKAIAFYHLFNFDSTEAHMHFDDIRIERIQGEAISQILGEQSPSSFIQPSACGNSFIVVERDTPPEDVITWLAEEHEKPRLFVHVLQYFKEGVVHIDYAVPHFQPDWVNGIRKFGIFFLGEPRRQAYEGGAKPYRITSTEAPEILRWWSRYQAAEVMAKLEDTRSTMRKADLRAADYYELSHTQPNPVNRLISLAISYEAMFSPHADGELSYRMAQCASQLIGRTPAERVQVFGEFKQFYNRRSKIMHGDYKAEVTHDECDRWASLIRRSILCYVVTYLRGCTDQKQFLDELSRAALDSTLAERIRKDSDIDTFLTNGR